MRLTDQLASWAAQLDVLSEAITIWTVPYPEDRKAIVDILVELREEIEKTRAEFSGPLDVEIETTMVDATAKPTTREDVRVAIKGILLESQLRCTVCNATPCICLLI